MKYDKSVEIIHVRYDWGDGGGVGSWRLLCLLVGLNNLAPQYEVIKYCQKI